MPRSQALITDFISSPKRLNFTKEVILPAKNKVYGCLSFVTSHGLQELPEDVKEYEVARHSLFFNDTGAKSIYKDYVKAIVTRENSVNGRKYSEDPTLMSWGLLNEPRCETWKVQPLAKTFKMEGTLELPATSETEEHASHKPIMCRQVPDLRMLKHGISVLLHMLALQDTYIESRQLSVALVSPSVAICGYCDRCRSASGLSRRGSRKCLHMLNHLTAPTW